MQAKTNTIFISLFSLYSSIAIYLNSRRKNQQKKLFRGFSKIKKLNQNSERKKRFFVSSNITIDFNAIFCFGVFVLLRLLWLLAPNTCSTILNGLQIWNKPYFALFHHNIIIEHIHRSSDCWCCCRRRRVVCAVAAVVAAPRSYTAANHHVHMYSYTLIWINIGTRVAATFRLSSFLSQLSLNGAIQNVCVLFCVRRVYALVQLWIFWRTSEEQYCIYNTYIRIHRYRKHEYNAVRFYRPICIWIKRHNIWTMKN